MKSKRPEDWTAEKKLKAIVKYENLDEEQRGIYLRKKGLHSVHIERWQQEFVEAYASGKKKIRGGDPRQRRIKELGGGWGARSILANAILKRINPLDDFYVAVEAMKEHCSWIKEHMKDNGIAQELHSIIHAIVWTDNQPHLFPSCKEVLGQSISQGIPVVVANLNALESKTALMNIVTKGNLGVKEEFNAKFGTPAQIGRL